MPSPKALLACLTLTLCIGVSPSPSPNTDPNDPLVKIHISSRKWMYEEQGHVKMHACKSCNPRQGGSIVMGMRNFYGIQEYDIEGGIVLMVPNHGQRKPFNKRDIKGRIALVDRGEGVPLSTKAQHAQKAGAIGVLIVDHGECDDSMQNCGWAGKVQDGGFGKKDQYANWMNVHVPVVLLHQNEGERLKSMMNISVVEVKNYGPQNVTMVALD
mmetsp:Transcript_37514/g.117263  ORF Transcript_37514/g.117263 Transcript_37514/m.117263 type:complete len:213 (-) Transcript_37514:105-743(-)